MTFTASAKNGNPWRSFIDNLLYNLAETNDPFVHLSIITQTSNLSIYQEILTNSSNIHVLQALLTLVQRKEERKKIISKIDEIKEDEESIIEAIDNIDRNTIITTVIPNIQYVESLEAILNAYTKDKQIIQCINKRYAELKIITIICNSLSKFNENFGHTTTMILYALASGFQKRLSQIELFNAADAILDNFATLKPDEPLDANTKNARTRILALAKDPTKNIYAMEQVKNYLILQLLGSKEAERIHLYLIAAGLAEDFFIITKILEISTDPKIINSILSTSSNQKLLDILKNRFVQPLAAAALSRFHEKELIVLSEIILNSDNLDLDDKILYLSEFNLWHFLPDSAWNFYSFEKTKELGTLALAYVGFGLSRKTRIDFFNNPTTESFTKYTPATPNTPQSITIGYDPYGLHEIFFEIKLQLTQLK